ncbi:hypothetical protein D9M68_762960 [compost metagenome]
MPTTPSAISSALPVPFLNNDFPPRALLATYQVLALNSETIPPVCTVLAVLGVQPVGSGSPRSAVQLPGSSVGTARWKTLAPVTSLN